MSSFNNLPIRLAAPPPPPQQQQEPSQSQPPLPSSTGPQQQEQQVQEQQVQEIQIGDQGLLSPSIDDPEETPSPPFTRPTAAIGIGIPQDAPANVAQWIEATCSQPRENHQFWMNDPKIVESLLTIHRSAKHLLDFTSSIVNNHEPTLGQRPIPVMSNGDVLFMTQLSNDISRSVGGISAVRHHGHGSRAAARKRTLREAEDRDREQQQQHAGSVKRVQVQQSHHRHHDHNHHSSSVPKFAGFDAGELSCRKCGRTDTPEWRKGPDGGVLCNVCGLIYAKQRRKMKSSRGGTHASQSHHG